MNKTDKIIKKMKINEDEQKLINEYYNHMWRRKDGDLKCPITQEIKSDKQMPTT